MKIAIKLTSTLKKRELPPWGICCIYKDVELIMNNFLDHKNWYEDYNRNDRKTELVCSEYYTCI